MEGDERGGYALSTLHPHMQLPKNKNSIYTHIQIYVYVHLNNYFPILELNTIYFSTLLQSTFHRLMFQMFQNWFINKNQGSFKDRKSS